MMNNDLIVVFDGLCNLCGAWVNFVGNRDKDNKFRFAAAQSDAGQKLLKKYDQDQIDIESVVLINKDNIYTKSTAAIRILRELGGIWKLFYALIIIPASIRDKLYSVIAKNRYKWFGKKSVCMIPDAKIKNKFL